jgi:hypothetical protein
MADPGPAGPTPAGAPHREDRGGDAELRAGGGAGPLGVRRFSAYRLAGAISAVVHAVLGSLLASWWRLKIPG